MKREIHYVVEGRPISWRRPNIVAGRPRTDVEQRHAKREHQWAAIKAGAVNTDVDSEGHYAIDVLAYYPDERMGDADRILGLPLDAMEGLIYKNDRQVAEVTCRRRIDACRPRVEVTVKRLRGNER